MRVGATGDCPRRATAPECLAGGDGGDARGAPRVAVILRSHCALQSTRSRSLLEIQFACERATSFAVPSGFSIHCAPAE